MHTLTWYIQTGFCLNLMGVRRYYTCIDSLMSPLYICNNQHLASMSSNDEIVCREWITSICYCFCFCKSFSFEGPCKGWYKCWLNKALEFCSAGLIHGEVVWSSDEVEYYQSCSINCDCEIIIEMANKELSMSLTQMLVSEISRCIIIMPWLV